MAIPAFPTTIPKVLMSDYSYKGGDGIVRTDMDTGLARQRKRFVGRPTKFNVQWTFSRKELGIFEKFFETDLFGGVGWFTIKLVNGVGETVYTARFVDGYEAKTQANEHIWTVTGVLEAVGRPVLP